MVSYKRYIVIIVLLVFFVSIKQTISPFPEIQNNEYTSLTKRSHILIKYCNKNAELCSFLPFQQGRANWLWLQAVQYVGKDIYAQYYPQLYDRLQDVTTLDTYREYPYVFGQYIIPDTIDENTTSREQSLLLGYKGLQSLCDMKLMEQVSQLNDKEFISLYYTTGHIVPCDSYLLPQMLGFVTFHHAHDVQQAIGYYRVAALSPNAPDILFNMPAILVGKYDDDRKSMMMRYQRFLSAQDQLNPDLSDSDVLFVLSTMQHALRKAIHHGFLSLIQETAQQYNCGQSMSCISKNIPGLFATSLGQCESVDQTEKTLCSLIAYAKDQSRWDEKGNIIYPLEPETMYYGRRPDREKRDIIPKE